MKYANDITNAVNNMRYYVSQIQELVKKQLDEDCTKGNEIGINVNVATKRFQCLGAMSTAAEWQDIYCENILANLKGAIEQDKMLYVINDNEDNEEVS